MPAASPAATPSAAPVKPATPATSRAAANKLKLQRLHTQHATKAIAALKKELAAERKKLDATEAETRKVLLDIKALEAEKNEGRAARLQASLDAKRTEARELRELLEAAEKRTKALKAKASSAASSTAKVLAPVEDQRLNARPDDAPSATKAPPQAAHTAHTALDARGGRGVADASAQQSAPKKPVARSPKKDGTSRAAKKAQQGRRSRGAGQQRATAASAGGPAGGETAVAAAVATRWLGAAGGPAVALAALAVLLAIGGALWASA